MGGGYVWAGAAGWVFVGGVGANGDWGRFDGPAAAPWRPLSAARLLSVAPLVCNRCPAALSATPGVGCAVAPPLVVAAPPRRRRQLRLIRRRQPLRYHQSPPPVASLRGCAAVSCRCAAAPPLPVAPPPPALRGCAAALSVAADTPPPSAPLPSVAAAASCAIAPAIRCAAARLRLSGGMGAGLGYARRVSLRRRMTMLSSSASRLKGSTARSSGLKMSWRYMGGSPSIIA